MSDASTIHAVIGQPADPMPFEFATEDEIRRFILECETGRDQPEPHQVRR